MCNSLNSQIIHEYLQSEGLSPKWMKENYNNYTESTIRRRKKIFKSKAIHDILSKVIFFSEIFNDFSIVVGCSSKNYRCKRK